MKKMSLVPLFFWFGLPAKFLLTWPLLVFAFFIPDLNAQDVYQVVGVGFYNVENLFDIIDDPEKDDEEFTPEGPKNYTEAVYGQKLQNLARVISVMGTDVSPDGIALLGLSEIENEGVVRDLLEQPGLKERDYGIIHYESPGNRGIDVGLIYQKKYFFPMNSRSLPVRFFEDGEARTTRDVLLVSGLLDGDTVHVFVNHWPSRRGGVARSQPFRNAAAMTCKLAIDSLRQRYTAPKVILMGDLNDDPVSPSVRQILRAERKERKAIQTGMFNPMYDFYRKGVGTVAWNDAWNLFDQILISDAWLPKDQEGYFFYKAGVFQQPWLHQKTGQYKGYPFRSFVGDSFTGGYSDHFPVYAFFVKKMKE